MMTDAPPRQPYTTPPPVAIREWRCPGCRRLCKRFKLAGMAEGEWLEYRCRCGSWSRLESVAGHVVVLPGQRPEAT